MTTATFGAAYAGAYDALYREKDYDRECDLVESLFVEYAADDVATVLDLGCGTGSHATRLASRGYLVTGVDRSREMLNRAREKSLSGDSTRWIEGDVRNVDALGPYDAALMMFAVLGYQLTNEDVQATFANIRRHLLPGGLLIFDAWYGPGVLSDPPGAGSRMVQTERGDIERDVTSLLDVRRHLCEVRYALRGAGTAATEETHVVRYFFPMEIEMYLEMAGFRTLRIAAFDDPSRDPDERTWNALVVAQAA